MELLMPSIGLIIWMIILFSCFGLTIVAVIKLVRNNELDILTKLFWSTLVVFVPVIGPILYIFRNRITKRGSTV